MKLLYYFLRDHKLVNTLSVVVLLLGAGAFLNMNLDVMPALDFKGFAIVVSYPESAPEDLEEQVVFPVEEILLSYPGIKEVTSESSFGMARIKVKFPAGYKDVAQAMNEIKEEVADASRFFPVGVQSIRYFQFKKSSAVHNFLFIKNYDPTNLKHKNFVTGFKNRLSGLKGILKVNDSRPLPEITLSFNSQSLALKGVSVSEVLLKLRQFLRPRALGGLLSGKDKTIIQLERGQAEGLVQQIKNLPIKFNALGHQTAIKDVAHVKYGPEDPDVQNYGDNGQKTYHFRVEKTLGSDLIKLDKKVQSLVQEFKKESQAQGLGIDIVETLNIMHFMKRQLDSLRDNGLVSLLLVLLTLLLFLSFRASICTLWGLPIAYAGTFVGLHLAGFNLNFLTMMGLLMVAGILVDDALIVTERYNALLAQGEVPLEAAKKSISELFWPVVGTALTSMVAFLPLVLIPSVLGNVLMTIPIVVMLALLFSILESFLILPSHLMTICPKPPKKLFFDRLFEKATLWYEHYLGFVLKFKYSVLALSVVVLIGAGWHSLDLEKNFRVSLTDKTLVLRGRLQSSSSKGDSFNQLRFLVSKVKESFTQEELVNLNVHIGKTWINHRPIEGVEVFELEASLNPALAKAGPLIDRVQKNLNTFLKSHEKKFDFVTVAKGYAGASEGEADQTFLTLEFLSKSSGKEMNLFNEVQKAFVPLQDQLGTPELGGAKKKVTRWGFVPDMSKLSQLGVTLEDVQATVLSDLKKFWVQDVRINGERAKVMAELDKNSFNETISRKPSSGAARFEPTQLWLQNRLGEPVALSKLGAWEASLVGESIEHLDGYKVQKIQFPILDSKKRDEILKKAKSIVKQLKQKWPQYVILASGESMEEKENRQWIIHSLIACLVGIYFVLVFVLGSFSQPLVVALPVLFGVVGALFAHKVHGVKVGVFSGVGLLGAIGVSVNGSLVMASQVGTLLRERLGESHIELIIEGAKSRFRALVLTSLTTLGGLFPLAYGWFGEGGGALTQELAFSMAWGIFAAIVMTLFVFPGCLALFCHRKRQAL